MKYVRGEVTNYIVPWGEVDALYIVLQSWARLLDIAKRRLHGERVGRNRLIGGLDYRRRAPKRTLRGEYQLDAFVARV